MIRPLTLVRASAGSGKTHFLSGHLLNLLLSGETPGKILANTFTRKAAGEMFARVITRLLRAHENQEICNSLAKELEWEKFYEGSRNPQLNPLLIEEVLKRFIENQASIRISTLDSFFVSLGQAFFTEFGLPGSWKIADPWELAETEEKALRLCMEKLGNETSKALLYLITGSDAPAQPGAYLMRQLRDLYQEFISTPASAWRLPEPYQSSLSQRIMPPADDLDVLIKQTTSKSLNKALTKLQTALREGQFEDILKSGFSERIVINNDYTYYKKPIPPEAISVVQKLVEYAKYEVLMRIHEQTAGLAALLTAWHDALLEESFSSGTISFRELGYSLSRGCDSLTTQDVFFRLDGEISHLLLDEFQDTSPAQWHTLNPLAGEIISKASISNTFLAVGDTKQAIYSWRGGTSELFDELTRLYPVLSSSVLQLNKTYRSYPGIVAFVNMIFSDIARNPALENSSSARESWMNEFQTHESNYAEDYGQIVVREIGPAIDALIETPEDRTLSRTELEEFALSNLWSDLEEINGDPSVNSIGILTRTNAQAQRLERFLSNRGIHVSGAGGEPLTHSRSIQLLISLCSLADHPGDTLAYEHLKDSPLGSWIVKLEGSAAITTARTLSVVIKQRMLNKGFSACLRDYAHGLRTITSTDEEDKIKYALSLAMGFERSGISRFSDFSRILSSSAIDSKAMGKVRVMTFHKSKGLEFDVVMLPFTSDHFYKSSTLRILKKQKNALSPADCIIRNCKKEIRQYFDEFERMYDDWVRAQTIEGLALSYVALTRAVHSLFIYVQPIGREANGQASPATLGNLIRGALPTHDLNVQADQTGGKVLYSTGNFEDKAGHSSVKILKAATIPKEVAFDTLPVKFIPSFALPKNTPKSTPTSFDSNLSTADSHKDSQGSRSTSGSQFGSLVHKALESLFWIDTNIDEMKSVQDKLASYPPDVREYLSRALQMPDIYSLFSKATYSAKDDLINLIIETELPFSLVNQNSLLVGRLDRVVISRHSDSPDSAHIIDFKTGAVPEISKMEQQSYAYRLFVKRKYKISSDNIYVYFAFLSTGQIIKM